MFENFDYKFVRIKNDEKKLVENYLLENKKILNYSIQYNILVKFYKKVVKLRSNMHCQNTPFFINFRINDESLLIISTIYKEKKEY